MKSKMVILILFLFTLAGVAIAWFWMQHLTENNQMSSSTVTGADVLAVWEASSSCILAVL
ncbi:hypothetical protein ACFOGI_14600 [Virgibacillus xinjiangensis]|uniref:Uncharacterized protein n=1 Tax=Virgibacillus xinjiangensis TaxID=393090 RepID=A0ABV7CZS4_9BACI